MLHNLKRCLDNFLNLNFLLEWWNVKSSAGITFANANGIFEDEKNMQRAVVSAKPIALTERRKNKKISKNLLTIMQML